MNGKWVGIVVMGMAVMAPGVLAEEAAKEPAVGTAAASTSTPAQAMPAASVMPPASEAVAEPSAQQVSQAIRDYVAMIEEDEGSFTLEDEGTGTPRTLTLERVHAQVSKTENRLFSSSTDMRDTTSWATLTVDFDVESYDGELEVVNTRIRTVDGQARASTPASSTSAPVTQ